MVSVEGIFGLEVIAKKPTGLGVLKASPGILVPSAPAIVTYLTYSLITSTFASLCSRLAQLKLGMLV